MTVLIKIITCSDELIEGPILARDNVSFTLYINQALVCQGHRCAGI